MCVIKQQGGLEMDIEKYLLDKGFSASFRGFDYIVDAVCMIRADQTLKKKFSKEIYPRLAKVYNVTPSAIARAMNYCIKQTNKKLTVAEFVCQVELITR